MHVIQIPLKLTYFSSKNPSSLICLWLKCLIFELVPMASRCLEKLYQHHSIHQELENDGCFHISSFISWTAYSKGYRSRKSWEIGLKSKSKICSYFNWKVKIWKPQGPLLPFLQVKKKKSQKNLLLHLKDESCDMFSILNSKGIWKIVRTKKIL